MVLGLGSEGSAELVLLLSAGKPIMSLSKPGSMVGRTEDGREARYKECRKCFRSARGLLFAPGYQIRNGIGPVIAVLEDAQSQLHPSGASTAPKS